MRAFAWSSIAAGILLTIAAFVIAADKPAINPWPSLIAGFCLTAIGIVMLTAERRPRDGEPLGARGDNHTRAHQPESPATPGGYVVSSSRSSLNMAPSALLSGGR